MKPVLAKTLFAAVLLTNLSTFAQGLNAQLSKANGSVAKGGVATGGGDICEDRIQGIRADLKKWIIEGGHQSLKLPAGFSAQKYKDEMLEKIQTTPFRCVGKGDAGYPVTVEGKPKVCRFDRSSSSSLITCDYEKFLVMTESDQYVLVHHEYAGLADVEPPNGADSDYRVSNQISGNLADQIVKKLVVKSGHDSFRDIPKDQLKGYIRSAIIAENKTFMCYPENPFPLYLEHMIKHADTGSVRESGSKVTFVFTTKMYVITTGDLSHRSIVRIDFNGNKATGLTVNVQMYEDINEGTISQPKVVKGWGPNLPQTCKVNKP